ncbi:hypothetical protein BpHYR1_000517 [Brachionus plicatilis]|uniref:Uncharacterized protein n=1 Tax=Brachionus plicatilis TaxID=10195 RepID=A0A3M7R465_BRAPC|nr:hypothetical protein BpHYR1_000517 [Brachionus plicatilis]
MLSSAKSRDQQTPGLNFWLNGDSSPEYDSLSHSMSLFSDISLSRSQENLNRDPVLPAQQTASKRAKKFELNRLTKIAIERALSSLDTNQAIEELYTVFIDPNEVSSFALMILKMIKNDFLIKKIGSFILKLMSNDYFTYSFLVRVFEAVFVEIRHQMDHNLAISEILSCFFSESEPISVEFLRPVLLKGVMKSQRSVIMFHTLNLAAKKIGYNKVRLIFSMSNLKIEDFIFRAYYRGGLKKLLLTNNIGWIVFDQRQRIFTRFIQRIKKTLLNLVNVNRAQNRRTDYSYLKDEFISIELNSKIFFRSLIYFCIKECILENGFLKNFFNDVESKMILEAMMDRPHFKYEPLFVLTHFEDIFVENKRLLEMIFWNLVIKNIMAESVLAKYRRFIGFDKNPASIPNILAFQRSKDEIYS